MFVTVGDGNFVAAVESAEKGVMIFTKKLCPHCKNMLKMLEKFQDIMPEVPIYAVDSEECPQSMVLAGVERVPTVCVVQNGTILVRKPGLMNRREMEAFYESA